jgi:hypothetical protein
MVERSTLGIAELLEHAATPRLIDFVHLDADTSSLEIIQAFPAERACVRNWEIQHTSQDAAKAGIQEFMQSRGCHVEDGQTTFYVHCHCKESQEGDKANVHITSRSGQVKQSIFSNQGAEFQPDGRVALERPAHLLRRLKRTKSAQAMTPV